MVHAAKPDLEIEDRGDTTLLSPTDLKKQFLTLLGETLKEEGFTMTRDAFHGISFVRERGDVRHFFDLAVTKGGNHVEVENLFGGVRFDAVERKVAAYEDHLPFVTDKDLAQRRTLGIWLGWSDDGFSRQTWKIKDEHSLLKALREVTDLFRTTGIPFLEKYSNPEEAMRVLAADNQEARRLTVLDTNRAKRAIAMFLETEGVAAALEMKNNKLAFLKSSNNDHYIEVLNWAKQTFRHWG
jgi:hypothetical protein